METINKLSLSGMLKTLSSTKKENYHRDRDRDRDREEDEEMGAGFFLLFILYLVLWIYALYILVQNFSILPDWAKIIGILGLTLNNISGGMFLTILVVYIGINSR